MPIIQRKEKIERVPSGLRMDKRVLDRLTAYAGYTNVPVVEIVEIAIQHVIDKDEHFHSTLNESTPLSFASGRKRKKTDEVRVFEQ